MPLPAAYGALLAKGAIAADPAQYQCVAKLGELSGRLARWRRRVNGLAGLFLRAEPAPRGLYIFGPVGTCGVDWKGQIAALLADGYTGAVSLETHWPGPAGDKLQASTICGWNLRFLLAQV